MAETRTLLVEIGVEDLPPGFMSEFEGFHRLCLERLQQEQFVPDDPTTGQEPLLYTPRRLAVKISGARTHQPEKTERRIGPPATRIDPDSPAVRGFAKSCRVDVDQLELLDGRLCCDAPAGGQALRDALPSLLPPLLAQIKSERRMRWNSDEHEFIRPVRWLCVLHGKELIDCELSGVRSKRTTRGHRFHCPEPFELEDANGYEEKLASQGYVIADVRARREKILEQAGNCAEGAVSDRRSWIDEVTAITEWPQVLDAGFDSQFLSLPPEVITETLETGLKALVRKNADGKVLPKISVVVDIESEAPEIIRRGYEKVARARLKDAHFFFEQDRKTSLESRRRSLEHTLFQEKLGTLADKAARLVKLAESLAPHCDASPEYTRRAAELCKCDLGTDIVGEYPKLQGITGGYYAAADGEHDKVALAIREHYQPHGSHDIPTAPESVALALADKADTLAGFWRIGSTPTSSRDPYALDRAAEALLLLLTENGINLDFTELTSWAAASYDAHFGSACPKDIKDDLDRYIFEKLHRVAGACAGKLASGRTTFIRSKLLAESIANADPRPTRPCDFVRRLSAVAAFIDHRAAGSLIQANKRISNILNKADVSDTPLDAALMVEPAELALLKAVNACRDQFARKIARYDYADALTVLAELHEPVDRFFTEVMVMTEDATTRNNRLALLQNIRQLFLKVADFSRLPQTGADEPEAEKPPRD